MSLKFLKKTVIKTSGATILGVAVLLIVFLATPTTASAAVTFSSSTRSTSNTVTIPPHSVGDLILIVARGDNYPTVPVSFTQIMQETALGAGSPARVRVAYMIATTTSHVSGTWSSSYDTVATVFSSSVGAGLQIGATSSVATSSTAAKVQYAALSLLDSSGDSVAYRWLRFSAVTNINADLVPTSFTRAIPTVGVNFDSYRLGVTSIPFYASSIGSATQWVTGSVEIKETAPPPSEVIFESPVTTNLICINFPVDCDGVPQASSTVNTNRYQSMYRFTGEGDTIQMNSPATTSIRMYAYQYNDAAAPLPYELGSPSVSLGTGFQFERDLVTSISSTIVAAGVHEWTMSTNYNATTSDQFLYLIFDPNTPYQSFDVYGNYFDLGWSMNGNNYNLAHLAPVIKVCKNGCPDNIFDSDIPNGSYIPFTRVVDLEPVATTTATSSSFTIGGSVNVMPEDYVDGIVFRVWIAHKSSVQQTSMLQAWETAMNAAPYAFAVEFPVTQFGTSEFSTTTDLSAYPEGEYQITGELVIPQGFVESLINAPSTIWAQLLDTLAFANGSSPSDNTTRKSGTFIIGQPTWYDLVVNDVVAIREEGINMALFDLNVCAPLSGDFDISKCLMLLVIPSDAAISSMTDNLVNNVLSIVPFGYITRFIQITTFNDPSIPPALEYTYGTSAPEELQGRGMSFQIFEAFPLIDTIVADDGTNKNIWDITMPYFEAVIALGVLGVILTDLVGLGVPNLSAVGGGVGAPMSGTIPVRQENDRNQGTTYGQAHRVPIKNNRGRYSRPRNYKHIIMD